MFACFCFYWFGNLVGRLVFYCVSVVLVLVICWGSVCCLLVWGRVLGVVCPFDWFVFDVVCL